MVPPWKEVMTNLDSKLKSRDITLSTKVCLVKAVVFPVVMYGYETWTIKKAEHWRIDAFGLWCWRRPLRVPWSSRRSNQSILKEISPGCSSEGLILKLKPQYFDHLMWRADHLKRPWYLERVRAGGEGDDRWWVGWMASPTQSMDMSLCKLWELVMDRKADVLWFMGLQRVAHNWATDMNWLQQPNYSVIHIFSKYKCTFQQNWKIFIIPQILR